MGVLQKPELTNLPYLAQPTILADGHKKGLSKIYNISGFVKGVTGAYSAQRLRANTSQYIRERSRHRHALRKSVRHFRAQEVF